MDLAEKLKSNLNSWRLRTAVIAEGFVGLSGELGIEISNELKAILMVVIAAFWMYCDTIRPSSTSLQSALPAEISPAPTDAQPSSLSRASAADDKPIT